MPGPAASGTRLPRRSYSLFGEPWRQSLRECRRCRCSGPRTRALRQRARPGQSATWPRPAPAARRVAPGLRNAAQPLARVRQTAARAGSQGGVSNRSLANVRLSAAWPHLTRALQHLCDGQARNVAPACPRPAASGAPRRTGERAANTRIAVAHRLSVTPASCLLRSEGSRQVQCKGARICICTRLLVGICIGSRPQRASEFAEYRDQVDLTACRRDRRCFGRSFGRPAAQHHDTAPRSKRQRPAYLPALPTRRTAMTCSTWYGIVGRPLRPTPPHGPLTNMATLAAMLQRTRHLIALCVLQHRHESHNNQETTFDFTEANYERVRQACRISSSTVSLRIAKRSVYCARHSMLMTLLDRDITPSPRIGRPGDALLSV